MKKLISLIFILGILLSISAAADNLGYFGYYGVDDKIDKLNDLAAEHGDGAVIRAFTRYTPFPYSYRVYHPYYGSYYRGYYDNYYDYYTYPRNRINYRDYGPTAYHAYHSSYPSGYRNYQYTYSESGDNIDLGFSFNGY